VKDDIVTSGNVEEGLWPILMRHEITRRDCEKSQE
jgi:hypothetical protein